MKKILPTLTLLLIATISQAQIRIIEVEPSTNTIKIKNFGGSTVDISTYRLCTLIKYTTNLTTGTTINSGSLNLTVGSEVELVVPGGASGTWPNLSAEADLGLYLAAGSFGSASAMVDFVQWGSAGHGRESVANTKGIWTTGEFVDGSEPYSYTGDGSQNGASFWEGFVANSAPTDISLSNSTVGENLAVNTTVGVLSSTDVNGSDTHTYTLVAGTGDTDNNAFDISGSNLVTDEIFNHEVKDTYSIRIQTDDNNGGLFEKAFTIMISDNNDVPTIVSLDNLLVAENQSTGTLVGSFTTTDEDAGDSHNYTLVSGTGDTDNSSFQVSGTTLLTTEIFNFEIKDTYSIRIQTDDSNGGLFEQSLTIMISDENDTPTAITLSDQLIAENQSIGTIVASLSSADEDTGDSHNYNLITGTGDTDNASFDVAGTDLVTNEIFNFEVKDTYTIRLQTDDNNGGLFEQSFTITIANGNDLPTQVSISNQSVVENQPLGTTIATFSTVDEDTGGTYTYNLVSGAGDTDNSSFTIDNDILKTNAVFDLNVKTTCSIRVQSEDKDGGAVENIFTITILDDGVNLAPTDIILSNNTLAENNTSSTEIGTLSSVDQNSADLHSYSLVAGAGDSDNSSFTISGETLLPTEVFNFEVKANYSIRIQSDDGNGGAFEKSFEINITDANDIPTDIEFVVNPIANTSPMGTVAGTFSTADEDSGDSHTYSLVAGTGDDNNNLFTIQGANLVTSTSLDDIVTPTLNARIRTTDTSNDFFEETFVISLDIITGIADQTLTRKVSVYPNPFQNQLQFDLPDHVHQVEISIYNFTGSRVYLSKEQSLIGNKITIDTSDLISGSYYVRLSNDSKTVLNTVIIKR